ncbi:MAG: hypothetical protein M3Q69_00960 [Acidobacteriota bacterium]|nr:hypothetical protein [Acidobacteriota bacterium]
MKQAIVALFLSFVAYVAPASAACKTDACRQAVAWKNGYTAILLDDAISRDDYFAVLDAVKAAHGAVAIEAERVLLGWVPRAAAAKLRAVRGVRGVTYEAVARPDTATQSEDARAALGFFNRVVRGEYEDTVEAGLAVHGAPLTGCVVDRPDRGRMKSVAAPDTAGDGARELADHLPLPQGARDRLRVAPNYWFNQPFQNPDMRGRITVQLFCLDSDGSIDPNLYTWTSTDYGIARDQVNGAFTFWANEAAARGVTLSFRVAVSDPFSRYLRRYVPISTKYEPITHPRPDDYLFVNDALAYHGYGASPLTNQNVFAQNEAFNRARKADATYGPFDRSFSVYLIYNPSPAPTVFSDGYRGFAMYDGPFTMLMWNTAGWGPSNLGRVLTHETGHIFWACDEYFDAPSNTGCNTCDYCVGNSGPRNQLTTPAMRNANCDYPGAGCDFQRVSCMMAEGLPATLCTHSPAQIGW